jgi:hypothetical protein
LDELEVEIGDEVLLTRYVGEDYAPEGYKCGIHLVWKYAKVLDKRVVPGKFGHHISTDSYLHYVEYRIEEEKNPEIVELLGERWNVSYDNYGGLTIGLPVGPRHVWSESVVRRTTSEPWEDYVKNVCGGPDTPETLQRLANEGFYIWGLSNK